MTIDLDQLSIFSLLTMLAGAIYFDIRTERIPNWLVAAGTVVAVTLHAVNSGALGLLTSVGGLSIAMAILLPFYIAGVMGAGDVKLMAAVGAFTGVHLALLAVGFALGVGVLEAIAILVLRGTRRLTWERYRQMGKTTLATGRWERPCSPPAGLCTSRPDKATPQENHFHSQLQSAWGRLARFCQQCRWNHNCDGKFCGTECDKQAA